MNCDYAGGRWRMSRMGWFLSGIRATMRRSNRTKHRRGHRLDFGDRHLMKAFRPTADCLTSSDRFFEDVEGLYSEMANTWRRHCRVRIESLSSLHLVPLQQVYIITQNPWVLRRTTSDTASNAFRLKARRPFQRFPWWNNSWLRMPRTCNSSRSSWSLGIEKTKKKVRKAAQDSQKDGWDRFPKKLLKAVFHELGRQKIINFKNIEGTHPQLSYLCNKRVWNTKIAFQGILEPIKAWDSFNWVEDSSSNIGSSRIHYHHRLRITTSDHKSKCLTLIIYHYKHREIRYHPSQHVPKNRYLILGLHLRYCKWDFCYQCGGSNWYVFGFTLYYRLAALKRYRR